MKAHTSLHEHGENHGGQPARTMAVSP